MSSGEFAMRLSRVAYLVLAWVFVACLIVQLFLVGLDLFEMTGEGQSLHRDFAYLYGWLAPLLVLLATIGRQPRQRQTLTVVLLVLFAVQTYLPSLAQEAPLVAAFHAVNALAIFWLAIHLATSAREGLQPLPPVGG